MSPPELTDQIKRKFPEAVVGTHAHRGDATVTVRRDCWREVARFLKEDPDLRMDFLMDLTAVDYLTFGKRPPAQGAFSPSGIALAPPSEIESGEPWPGPATSARFEVVAHFYSLSHRHRLRLKAPVEEADARIDSLTALWPAANWFEREVWDMFGIRFSGHPDLKRLLMYEAFEGHPLRKDYPVNRRQPLVGPID